MHTGKDPQVAKGRLFAGFEQSLDMGGEVPFQCRKELELIEGPPCATMLRHRSVRSPIILNVKLASQILQKVFLSR